MVPPRLGGLGRCRGNLLTWVELWKQILVGSQIPWRAILVCILFLLMSLRLTFSRSCGMLGLTIACSGNGLLVPSPSLRRRVIMVSSTLSPPCSDP